MSETESYWAVIELMGHVRIAGRVSEVERYGAKCGRVDIPTGPETFVTQFFGGASLYRETPCTEDVARRVAEQGSHKPVWAYGLEHPALPAARTVDDPYSRFTDTEDDVGA